MSQQILTQADFGAGIYRGHEAPPNAVFDAVNALVDDEGQLFRRGGTSYLTTSDSGNALTGLAIATLVGGDRIVAWSGTHLYVYSGGGFVEAAIGAQAGTMRAIGRPTVIDGSMYIPDTSEAEVTKYAGSFKTANGGNGTWSFGDATITFTSGQVDAGMMTQGSPHLVVASITDATHGEMQYLGADSFSGGQKVMWPAYTIPLGIAAVIPGPGVLHLASAGTRIIYARGSRVAFSDPVSAGINPDDFDDASQYHQLSGDSQITGAQGIGTTCIVFTNSGVWTISNLDLDPVDPDGNVQHQVQQVNSDVLLWGESGLADFGGSVVVPALDDVYLFSLVGPPQAISEGIRPLYRAYAQAGYQPGQAAVYRGHYLLPIVNGTTLVDVLVCRLDRGFAWTRWSGHGACIAYSIYVQSTATASPRLFGLSGQRIIELTGCFTPGTGNPTDINSTTHVLTVDTVDQALGDAPRPGTATKVRATYEMTQQGGTAASAMSVSRGPTTASFSALTSITGGLISDGLTASSWRVNLKAPALRYRFQTSGPVATFTLRSLETIYRPTGRL